MHTTLYSHIDGAIVDARTFVLRHMPINLTHDEIYEDLIGDPEMARAFANAAQYLPPNSLGRHISVDTEEWGFLTFNVKLQPTEKYPAFLIPKQSLFLTHESKLSRALQLPMRVEMQWNMMHYAFTRMQDYAEPNMIAFLFPWIRELIADWREQNPVTAFVKTKTRIALDREAVAILNGRAPRNFPRMTEQLNEVCRSGKALFSQYRMLESTHGGALPSPIVVSQLATKSMPAWLMEHVGDVLGDWCEECERITAQDGSDMLKKRRKR